jgi:type IV pilus assembly protein PilN
MIKINLLPRTQRKVRVGQRQLFVFLLLVLVEVGALVVAQIWKGDEVATRQKEAKVLADDVAELQKAVRDYDTLVRRKTQLQVQKQVMDQLESWRAGPVRIMTELSAILSVGKGPTALPVAPKPETGEKQDSPRFDQKWDPRRLWLEGVTEKNGWVYLSGRAKDHDDVAELIRRMEVSKVFAQIGKAENMQVSDRRLGMQVVRFSLRAQVAE